MRKMIVSLLASWFVLLFKYLMTHHPLSEQDNGKICSSAQSDAIIHQHHSQLYYYYYFIHRNTHIHLNI